MAFEFHQYRPLVHSGDVSSCILELGCPGSAAKGCPAVVRGVHFLFNRRASFHTRLCLLDGGADEVAPFGPRAVVIPHLGHA
jgi:hypothetical protein